MTARRLTGFLLAIAGAAGFTACLKSLVAGMEDVIRVDGGSCASGGAQSPGPGGVTARERARSTQ